MINSLNFTTFDFQKVHSVGVFQMRILGRKKIVSDKKPFPYFSFLSFQMNFMDLANLLDNDGNMQNEMMVMAFAATLLSTVPVLLGMYIFWFDISRVSRKYKMAFYKMFMPSQA